MLTHNNCWLLNLRDTSIATRVSFGTWLIPRAAFARVVHTTLADFTPPDGCCPRYYVGNLLLWRTDHNTCELGSEMLLLHIVSPSSSCSGCNPCVKYLGFVVSEGQRTLTVDRVSLIRRMPPPKMQAQMCSWLGVINFTRHWMLPDCSYHNKLLRQCTLTACAQEIVWTELMMQSFNELKHALYLVFPML